MEASLHQRRKLLSWAKKFNHHKFQVLSQSDQRSLSSKNLLRELLLLVPLLHPPCPNLIASLPGRPQNPGKEWKPILTTQAGGSDFTYRSMTRVSKWWREFSSLLCSMDKCLGYVHVQGLAHQQATAFRLPSAQLEKDGTWTAPTFLGVLGQRDYLPPKDFKELEIVKSCGMKKWWHWPWPSRGVPFIPECPQGCSAGQCKSSANASPPWLRVATNLTSICWMWHRGTLWSLPLQRGPCCWHPEWKNWSVCPPPVSQLLQSQRRLYSPRSCPGAKEKTTSTPWCYPFLGRWVWTISSSWCGPAYEHTPRVPTGSHLHGVPGVVCLSLPSDGRCNFNAKPRSLHKHPYG